MKEACKKIIENGIPESEEACKVILETIKSSLLPCPICGSKVYMRKEFYGNSNYGSGSREIICCDHCRLEMKGTDTSWMEEWRFVEQIAEFANKWNTRCGGVGNETQT